nr:hypothetical protein [Tanacetum cinerariifolium]
MIIVLDMYRFDFPIYKSYQEAKKPFFVQPVPSTCSFLIFLRSSRVISPNKRLVHNPFALWVQLIKASQVQMQDLMKRSVKLNFNVGCGSVLERYVARGGPLNLQYTRLFRVDRSEDCYYIRDRISNGKWSWNWSRLVLGGRNTDALNLLLDKIGNAEVG